MVRFYLYHKRSRIMHPISTYPSPPPRTGAISAIRMRNCRSSSVDTLIMSYLSLVCEFMLNSMRQITKTVDVKQNAGRYTLSNSLVSMKNGSLNLYPDPVTSGYLVKVL
jgi:hypothetical protein